MTKQATRWTRCISLLLMVIMQAAVNGDYELEVKFFRFDILNQRCEECHLSNGTTVSGGCCDTNSIVGEQCSSTECDVYFTFCHERLLNTRNNSRGCPTMELNRMNNSIPNTDGVSFNNVVFGLQMNPVIFRGNKWNGTQFYIEFIDRDVDEDDPDDLIDTLAIDLDIPVGASISHNTFTGRFNNAQVELSFRVVCAENYYGPDCTQFCNESSCPCDPGFTGEFCEIDINYCEEVNCTEIDYCTGINCNGNGQCIQNFSSFHCQCICSTNTSECNIDSDCRSNENCVEVLGSYTCECGPGFTGEQCDQVIDFCMGINCSGHGNCTIVDGTYNSSYSCECNPDYTGTECEHKVDNCVSVDCGENKQCLERGNSYECICREGFSGENCEEFTSSHPTQETEFISSHPTQEIEFISSHPTQETEFSQPKMNTSLDVIIGGAVGGALVLILVIILLVLIIIVCLQRKNIKRTHYNVEDVLKSQSVTLGDNPVNVANTDQQKLVEEEQGRAEFDNPIYNDFIENGCEPTTFTSLTKALELSAPNLESSPWKPETGMNLNSVALTTSLNEVVVDHTNPICSAEEMAGNANPLFTQSNQKGGTISSEQEATSCTLVKSTIYDEDFLKPDMNEDESQTGNEDFKKEQHHSNSFSKHSYRCQDYEDIK